MDVVCRWVKNTLVSFFVDIKKQELGDKDIFLSTNWPPVALLQDKSVLLYERRSTFLFTSFFTIFKALLNCWERGLFKVRRFSCQRCLGALS